MESFQLRPLIWDGNTLKLLDQRRIPLRKVYLSCSDLKSVVEAIRSMAVRGAPAIAVSGAFGILLEIRKASGFPLQMAKPDYSVFLEACTLLGQSRPTAVNLSRMLENLKRILTPNFWNNSPIGTILETLEEFAIQEFQKDIQANKAIGANALTLFSEKEELQILTHCNTGALATAGYGTALGIIRSLHSSGKKVHVYASETRPYLQGARLTAFEMLEEGIPCTILTDGMSSWLMTERKMDAILVGCDRIARNGDVANKIGTLNLAIVAKEFGVPFYVAATRDSFDPSLASGKEIPIEMRDESEITQLSFLKDENDEPILKPGTIAPIGVHALNPGFDITPAKYIASIITEEGIFRPGESPPSLHL